MCLNFRHILSLQAYQILGNMKLRLDCGKDKVQQNFDTKSWVDLVKDEARHIDTLVYVRESCIGRRQYWR